MGSCAVTVMMPAYNAERFVGDAIDSLRGQTFAGWELLVIDDGSTDGTCHVVRRYDDSRIRLISQSNRGEAAARNVALNQARGEFLAFLDADDLFLPRHLELAVRHLENHPRHSGVYCDGFYVTAEARRLKRLSARRRGPFTGDIFTEVARGSDLVCPPVAVVLRRDLIQAHGLRFDEDITIGPDWDFFLQFAALGAFGYVDEPTCLYRLHGTNITVRTARNRRLQETARCRAKAVKMAAFARCPLDVRINVFHDLLVSALHDAPDRQREVVEWPEFLALPARDRACLLRLLASSAILSGTGEALVLEWLRRSRVADPSDGRARAVSLLYRLSPTLCSLLLRLRRAGRTDAAGRGPYADLHEASA